MNELPTTAAGTLNLLANTQTEIDVFSDSVIRSVKEGEVSAIKVLIQLKAMEKATGRILNEIKENYLTEAEKHPESRFEYMGNQIEKAELGTKYNYDHCGDPVYRFHLQQVESATISLKNREAFLKALKEPITIVDEMTGEVVTIVPPLKSSTSGLKVTIK